MEKVISAELALVIGVQKIIRTDQNQECQATEFFCKNGKRSTDMTFLLASADLSQLALYCRELNKNWLVYLSSSDNQGKMCPVRPFLIKKRE